MKPNKPKNPNIAKARLKRKKARAARKLRRQRAILAGTYKPPQPKPKAEPQKRGWVDYHKYIRSKAWARKRQQALEHYGHKCSICKSPDRLRVHHKSYQNLGGEPLEDLRVLCQGCHNNIHEDKGYIDDITAEYLALKL